MDCHLSTLFCENDIADIYRFLALYTETSVSLYIRGKPTRPGFGESACSAARPPRLPTSRLQFGPLWET